MERSQFTFYRSFYEALRRLPKKARLEAYEAIAAYALDGVEPDADGAAATLIYSDGEGKAAAKDGYTLAASGDGYVLRDGEGNEYAVDLKWSPQGTENSVTIHGEFITDATIKEYEGATNTAYHGYFGLVGVQS